MKRYWLFTPPAVLVSLVGGFLVWAWWVPAIVSEWRY